MQKKQRKPKIDLKPHVFLVILAGVIALLVLLLLCFKSEDIGFNIEKAGTLDSGWEAIGEDGSREAITLPADLDTPAGKSSVIETVLPDTLPSPCVICLRSSMQTVRAYLNGELLHEYGTGDELQPESDPGSAWVLFRLPQDSEGKTLRLELTSPYANFSGTVSRIYASTKAAIMFDIFSSYALNFFVFIALVVIGIILLILFFSTVSPGLRNTSLLYLALFSLIVALWIFGESKTMQFFTGNRYLVTNLSFYTLLVIPLPMILYLDSAYKKHVPSHLTFFFWLFSANLIVSIVLSLTGISDFFISLISLHVLLLAFIIVMISSLICEIVKYHNREVRNQLIGMCILSITCICEIVTIWTDSFDLVSKFMCAGILVYVLFMGTTTFRQLLVMSKKSQEADYFRRLSLTDVVTMGKNRMAFEEDANTVFSSDGLTGSRLLLFDLDHLKQINDTIGHQSGDDAIRQAFRCLSEAFSEIGACYRIGGDEFACIVRSSSESVIEACIQKLDELIRETDEKTEYDFGISFGIGTFDPKTEDFESFFSLVDQALYRNKEKKFRTAAETV